MQTGHAMNSDASPAASALAEMAEKFEGAAPQEILAWAIARYQPRIVLSCSFGGPTAIVALDIVMSIAPATPVYYLDTDLLFPETHALIARVAERYGISPIKVTPELSLAEQAREHGDRLWERSPDDCCALRKVAPQERFLSSHDAWITGLRRDQAPTRMRTPVVQWDERFGLAKVNPLAAWDERMVWAYVRAHDLPYNELHDRGYPTLGCTMCTAAVKDGEPPRAGRWNGFAKVECGLHGK